MIFTILGGTLITVAVLIVCTKPLLAALGYVCNRCRHGDTCARYTGTDDTVHVHSHPSSGAGDATTVRQMLSRWNVNGFTTSQPTRPINLNAVIIDRLPPYPGRDDRVSEMVAESASAPPPYSGHEMDTFASPEYGREHSMPPPPPPPPVWDSSPRHVQYGISRTPAGPIVWDTAEPITTDRIDVDDYKEIMV